MERVHIVRFGHRNEHRPVWAALDVKRLRIYMPRDCSVEIQIASQVGCVRWRERRIDVKAITRKMVVLLSDVDLRAGWKDPQGGDEQGENGNPRFHTPASDQPAPPLPQRTACLSRITATQFV